MFSRIQRETYNLLESEQIVTAQGSSEQLACLNGVLTQKALMLHCNNA